MQVHTLGDLWRTWSQPPPPSLSSALCGVKWQAVSPEGTVCHWLPHSLKFYDKSFLLFLYSLCWREIVSFSYVIRMTPWWAQSRHQISEIQVSFPDNTSRRPPSSRFFSVTGTPQGLAEKLETKIFNLSTYNPTANDIWIIWHTTRREHQQQQEEEKDEKFEENCYLC